MATDEILYRQDGSVGRIIFNRPQAHNSLTVPIYHRLVEIVKEIEKESKTRVLILEGAGGKAFSAGTDINQFRHLSSPEDAVNYETMLESVVSQLERLELPTIAKIEGYATGGGLQLVLACDLRLCAPNARFGAPIARTLGNCLSVPGYARLVEQIGPAVAKELIFTARLADAQEALRIGMVSEIVDHGELESRVLEVARTIASNAPLTLKATKASIHSVLESRRPAINQELILSCYMSEDFKEGVAAFLEKRQPRWQGK